MSQMFLGLARAHFLSDHGQCKAFDAGADGYSRAEGCGIFIIKRLQDALNENDRIYGVIKEVEVNQCGNAKSITHPHGPTQARLFKRLLAKTGYHPSSISVIEAHGTGTQVGRHMYLLKPLSLNLCRLEMLLKCQVSPQCSAGSIPRVIRCISRLSKPISATPKRPLVLRVWPSSC